MSDALVVGRLSVMLGLDQSEFLAGLDSARAHSAKAFLEFGAASEKATQKVEAGVVSATAAFSGFTNGVTPAATKIANLTDRLGLQRQQFSLLERELEQTVTKYGEGSIQAERKRLSVERLTAGIKANERSLDDLNKQEAEGAKVSLEMSVNVKKAADAAENGSQDMSGLARAIDALNDNIKDSGQGFNALHEAVAEIL